MADESNRVPDVRVTTIRLDDESHGAVEAQAKARGLSASAYMRIAIEAKLAHDLALSGDVGHLARLIAAEAREVDQLAARLAEALKPPK